MSGPERRLSIAETVQATDSFLRHAGREFLVVFYTSLRSLKLYPIENAQVQKALDDLASTTKHVLDVERELEVRVSGEFIFVNSTRLRLDLDNYASFSHILGVLRQCGVGAVRMEEGVDRRQLQVFVSLLLSYAAREANPNKVFELGQKLTDAGATGVLVEPPLESAEDQADEERQKEAAKRTYAQSVAVTKEVINSIRLGRTANVKKVKRASLSVAIGGALLAVSGLFFIIMLVHLIQWATDWPLWVCYGLVASAGAIAGLAALWSAKKVGASVHVLPVKTMQSMKEDAQWITQTIASNKT